MITETRHQDSSSAPSHQSLATEIGEWRQWWEELAEMGEPHFGEMGTRLAQFREHLAAHFAEEENGAFLKLVNMADSQTVNEVARLQDEHKMFLTDLDSLVNRLQACDCDMGNWGNARTEFEDFLDRLNSHEEVEEELNERIDAMST